MIPAVIVIVILAAVVGAFLLARKRQNSAEIVAEPGELYEPRAPLREFHVVGDGAHVYFDVPLPPGEVDEVLKRLLVREAVEVLRGKQAQQLPLDGVAEVRAFGVRAGQDVEAGSLSLEVPGALPILDNPEVVPHYSSVPFDPLTHLGEKEHAAPVESGAVQAGTGDAAVLKPLSEELRFTAAVESGLRAQGLDPATMSAGDLALGLMRLAGYPVSESDEAGTYIVSVPGARTYLRIVDHGPGDYPELDEQQMKAFAVGFAGARSDRGILVTEKYGPYMIYDAERRNPKTKFVTRERLQDFVDSFSMR